MSKNSWREISETIGMDRKECMKRKTDHNKQWGSRRDKVPGIYLFLSWLAPQKKHQDVTKIMHKHECWRWHRPLRGFTVGSTKIHSSSLSLQLYFPCLWVCRNQRHNVIIRQWAWVHVDLPDNLFRTVRLVCGDVTLQCTNCARAPGSGLFRSIAAIASWL